MKGTNGSGPSTESEHCCSFQRGVEVGKRFARVCVWM